MEINYDVAIAEDTLFLVDLCPKENFPPGSKEENLAQKWLNHLCTYEVDDMDDKRLRNVYISHLCTALIQKELYGPFVKEPTKGKLEKIDFHAATSCPNTYTMLNTQQPQLPQQSNAHSTFQGRNTSDACLSMGGIVQPSSDSTVVNATQNSSPTGMDSQGFISVGSTNLCFNVTSGGAGSSCSCPPKPCQCSLSGQPCTCNRSSAGADTSVMLNQDVVCDYLMKRLTKTPDFLNNSDATSTSFMNFCKEHSMESETQEQPASHLSLERCKNCFIPKSQCSMAETNVSSVSREQRCASPPLDLEDMREDIQKLLAAIMAELSGDVDPGSNDYLDRELARYKTFLMTNSKLSTHFCCLKSEMKLRNCLLLNLQNDLVKLLNEQK